MIDERITGRVRELLESSSTLSALDWTATGRGAKCYALDVTVEYNVTEVWWTLSYQGLDTGYRDRITTREKLLFKINEGMARALLAVRCWDEAGVTPPCLAEERAGRGLRRFAPTPGKGKRTEYEEARLQASLRRMGRK